MRAHRPSRGRLAVVASVVCSGLLVVAGTTPAFAQPTPAPSAPPPKVTKPTEQGAASSTADKLAEAKRLGHKVEVPGLAKAASTTFANPDGTLTDEITQSPTRTKAADGSLVTIDAGLATKKGRLATKATSSKVSFRSTASGTAAQRKANATEQTGSAASGTTPDVAELDLPGAPDITMGFGAALPTPTIEEDTATYQLSPSTTLQATAMDDGFVEDVVLSAAPTGAVSYKFPLAVAGGLTPKLEEGVLHFVDASGAVVATSRPLQMWDAHRDTAGDPDHLSALNAALTQTGSSWELTLTPSSSYLSDPATEYPVVIDPTVTTMDNSDASYYAGNTTDYSAEPWLRVGRFATASWRTWFRWNTGPFTGRAIISAKMQLFEYSAGSCSPKATTAYPTTTDRSNNANNVHVDNDSAWIDSATFNTGGDGCTGQPNGYQDFEVTKLTEAFTSGEEPYYGIELQAPHETDTSEYKIFCSRNAATPGTGHCEGDTGDPKLVITYKPEMGPSSTYAQVSHKLNERSQLSINTADGNASVKNSDLHMAGRELDLNVDRFYNSQDTTTGQFGVGWRASIGADVYLNKGSNNDRWAYVSPGGTWYTRFARYTSAENNLLGPDYSTNDFHAPKFGGMDAELHDNSNGTYTLKFHNSREKYVFKDLTDGSGNMYLFADKDRNDNTITYGYTTGTHLLSTITDSHGRVFDVHHNAAGFIDTITERAAYAVGTPRVWTYHYNTGNRLDYYQDPTGARTDYVYSTTANPDGTFPLTTITDPTGSDGVNRPTTTLAYTNGQTVTVDYKADAVGNVKRFTYAYSTDTDAAATACKYNSADIKFDYFTTVSNVSDPQGGDTKYCYKDRSQPPHRDDPNSDDDDSGKKRVVDGLQHRRTMSFTPDFAALSGTDQGNEGTTSGSTVYSYDINNRLTSATRPKDTTSSAAGSTTFAYKNDKTDTAGGSFLPSSTASNGSSCSSSKYDSKGNLTDSYTGLSGTNADNCATNAGTRHSSVKSNDDGTPTTAYGPTYDHLNSPTDADKIQYFYVKSTDSDPNNIGELSKVVRPGGNVACTTNRTGCTTYTYDNYSRAATTTDGNGQATTFSYDKDDRITQVLSAGATTCTFSAGTCIQYAYDNEGNLHQRTDRNGITVFAHDLLNHPAGQTQPDGTVLATTYDGAGNLTKYQQTVPGQTVDTVTYTYDAANELIRIDDAAGTFNYTYNSDARPTQLTLPSSSGVTIAYDYTKSGKVKSINPSGTALPKYAYDYGNGSADTDQLHKTTVNGTDTIEYTYDSNDRLEHVNATPGTNYAYSYDFDSNLRSSKAGTAAAVWYGYNENDQLCWSGTNDSPSAAMAETCDATPSGDTTYTSDKTGNNVGSGTGPIHYNNQGQVDQISSPTGAGPVAQTYADQGNQLRLTAGGLTYTDGSKLGVTAQRTTSGVTYYTRDNNGQIVDEHGASGTYYYLLDRQGSTMALIDTAGGKAGSYSYDPYGKTTAVSGTSTTAAQNSPWRYTGGYQDLTDSYYHFGARYYDTAGHFTSADNVAGSIGRAEKYNSYTYTAGDPVNSTDQSGNYSYNDLATDLSVVGGFAAIGAVIGTVGGPPGILIGGIVGLGAGFQVALIHGLYF